MIPKCFVYYVLLDLIKICRFFGLRLVGYFAWLKTFSVWLLVGWKIPGFWVG